MRRIYFIVIKSVRYKSSNSFWFLSETSEGMSGGLSATTTFLFEFYSVNLYLLFLLTDLWCCVECVWSVSYLQQTADPNSSLTTNKTGSKHQRGLPAADAGTCPVSRCSLTSRWRVTRWVGSSSGSLEMSSR